MKKIRILFFIFITIIIQFPLFNEEISIDILSNIMTQIETKVKEYKELNYDEKVQNLIIEMKNIISAYKNKGENIKSPDKNLLAKIDEFELRIKQIRYFNVDDDLLISIKYFKNRFKIFEKTVTVDTNQEINNILQKIQTNDISIESSEYKKAITFLFTKIQQLESNLEYFAQNKLKEENALKTSDDEKLKKLEDLEKRLNDILSNKDNTELTDLLKKIDSMGLSKDKQEALEEKINKLISEREIEKKAILSPVHKNQYGKEFSFQLNLSLTGIHATVSTGILFPKIGNVCAMGLLANFNVTMPGIYVSEKYRSAALTGSFFLAFFSPMFVNYVRIYFGADAQAGFIFSLTKFDLLDQNITLAIYGFGGLEFYMTRQVAFFIEAGAGIMHAFPFNADVYNPVPQTPLVIAMKENNNNGTGIKLNFGMRIYFAKSEKNTGEQKIIDSNIFKIK